jgi:DNA-binding IclR family transcriptional regulator
VRADGLARVVDAAVPGVSALAAPVFDASGALVLSLTAIGPTAVLDTAAGGSAAVLLQQAAAGLSALLGWRGQATKT